MIYNTGFESRYSGFAHRLYRLYYCHMLLRGVYRDLFGKPENERTLGRHK
jgi:hypothetical protein